MLGMVVTVQVLGVTPEILQKSEVIPKGIFYNKNLELSGMEYIQKKMSWYAEVVNVSISSDPKAIIEASVENNDGKVLWRKEFTGSIKDTIIVVPGEGYLTSFKNRSDQALIVDYSLETALFEDKDGNFVITQHGKYLFVLVAVGISLICIIVGAVNMKKLVKKSGELFLIL